MVAGARAPRPHCGTTVMFEAAQSWSNEKDRQAMGNQGQEDTRFIVPVDRSGNERLVTLGGRCPSCSKAVILVVHIQHDGHRARFAWPEGITRTPIPDSVPPHIAEDYREAVLVIPYSPKASAALSRRCLQHLPHEKGIKADTLEREINAAPARRGSVAR